MKTLSWTVALIILLVANVWATSNLNLSKSNINRLRGARLVRASVELHGQASFLAYTTPADADFLLTDVCIGNAPGGVLIAIGGAALVQLTSGTCEHFSPGMILTPDAPLTCTAFDPETNGFCTISGSLGQPFPATPTPRS
jgi:hypothetical protein